MGSAPAPPSRPPRLGACRRNHDGSKKWDRRPTADPFSVRLDRAHRRNRRTSGMHATSDALVWHYSDRLLGETMKPGFAGRRPARPLVPAGARGVRPAAGKCDHGPQRGHGAAVERAYSETISSSTRLFLKRPSGVELSAIGWDFPWPTVCILAPLVAPCAR